MTRAQSVARDSTNVVELTGFRDRVTGAYPQDALASVTLYAPDGVAVPGAVDIPVTLDGATSGLNAIYRGEIGSAVVLLPLRTYQAVLTVEVAGKQRTFYTDVRVVE